MTDIHFINLSKIMEEEKKVPRKQVKQLKQQIHIMHWLYRYTYKHAHNSYPV